ncbi:DNA-binding protein [Flavobacteriaceae bacterium PRS1]|nr:DNA-binding protein [Flavobacteriaceae bacterium PRS1]
MDNPFDEMNERLSQIDSKLTYLQEIAENEKQIDKILNIDEACDLLKVKKITIYRKVKNNTIPHMKRGKKLLFNRNTLLEWLQESSNNII